MRRRTQAKLLRGAVFLQQIVIPAKNIINCIASVAKMKIKQLAMRLLRVGMSAAYGCIKLFTRPRDRVVFLSRQSDKPSPDFILLAEKISCFSPTTETVFSCKLGLKSEMNASYIPLLLRQMVLLATSRGCITESYIPAVSMLRHRRGMRVVQIWHSMAAIKKFGWQTVDTPEGSSSDTARLMCMHHGYDWVVVGSEYMKPFFAEAMNTPPEKILALGAPHADALLSVGKGGTRPAIEEKYPQIKGRRLVVYLPTMRRGRAIDCAEFINAVDSEKCALIVKLHPLDRDTHIDDQRVIIDTDSATADLICAADAVVTDYSGTASDAALLGIPVYFFLPDIEEYSRSCGINMDVREVFQAMSFECGEKLAAALLTEPEPQELDRQRELLSGGCCGNSCEQIARLLF